MIWIFSSVFEIFSTTFVSMMPSSISNTVPTLAAFTSAFCSRVGFIVMRPGLMLSLSSLAMPNSTMSPLFNSTGSPANSPTRNLGPCKSPRHVIFLPFSLAHFRMIG